MNANAMTSVMSVANAASKYKGVEVGTASPAQIVAMLCGGILRFVGEASAALETQDRARAGDRIGRAMAIVEELLATLDPTHAPELADNLIALYGFCKRRLFEANLSQNRQALDDVALAIIPLKEAWAEIARSAGK